MGCIQSTTTTECLTNFSSSTTESIMSKHSDSTSKEGTIKPTDTSGIEPSATPHSVAEIEGSVTSSSEDVVLRVFCIGDYGHPNPRLAADMNNYALITGRPDCILGLGDNFYEHGVDSVDDDLFNSCWRDVYLKYETLKCPWHMVLGNHDYRGSIDAQIDYTTSKHNADGVWHMPSNNYVVNYDSVGFYALDTNSVSWETRCKHQGMPRHNSKYISWLESALKAAESDKLKIVFAHHPMYTRGTNHARSGQLLRNDAFTYTDPKTNLPVTLPGYRLEQVLTENGVALYITGHEHVFQYHEARGVHSFVCGAAFESHFYGGEDITQPITWVDDKSSTGFLAIEVRRDLSVRCRFMAKNVDDENGMPVVLYEVDVPSGKS